MNRVVAGEFEISAGPEWKHSSEGPQHVFKRDDADVVMTLFSVRDVPPSERSNVVHELRTMAIRTATDEAAKPDLVPVTPEDDGRCLSIWTTTTDSLTCFGELVVSARDAVLLLSFESDNQPDAVAVFERLKTQLRAGPKVEF